MFGCGARIGCAIILLILGAVGWHYRAKWMPKVKEFIAGETGVRLGAHHAPLTYSWEAT